MDKFVVSALKYRPATFDTVVGQHSITSTLKNAIKQGQVAQAFLFCGPRGVGKTTCARILARVINCEQVSEQFEACEACESCKSFRSGNSLNIFELDAASNNSVDGIRNLTDQVRFAPQLGKYKIYIIDEVHMLSQQAFNAFLKTLEEPPAHAVFILATTEKHKIIPTILSRCQIFDFNRIGVKDIASHLMSIAEKEGIKAEQDALHTIAQKADGALRDALSIFDQVVNFSGGDITYQNVIDNLNILDYDYYFKVTDAIVSGSISESLLIFNDILHNGFDGQNFMNGLAAHFRNLLVCKDQATLQLLEVGENIQEKYQKQSLQCTEAFLLKALAITNQCDVQYRMSKHQRLLVELALMQLCSVLSTDEKKTPDAEKLSIKPPETAKPIEKKQDTIPESPAAEPKPIIKENKVQETPIAEEAPPEDYSKKPEEQPEKPLPKPASKPALHKTDSISIKVEFDTEDDESQENKPETETNQSLAKERNMQPFTQQQLQTVWDNYTQQVKQKRKESLYATLTGNKPELRDDFHIQLTIDNKVQEEVIRKEKTTLLQFLKKELKNDDIRLDTVIIDAPENKKLYTSKEKYQHLVAKNPNLQKLKQQLDLEIDY